MRKFLIFVIVVVLFLFGLYRWQTLRTARHPEKYTFATSPAIDPSNLKVLAALDDEFTQLVNSVVPSVVSITTTKRVQVQTMPDFWEQFFGERFRTMPREQIENSLGSGVIVSKEGHILTNNHVIDGVDEIQVFLSDGRRLPAHLIGSDKTTDLAVLKIEAKDLAPLPFGDSDKVQVGQHVVAVGNPFGFEETVTQGIISAKGRRSSDSGNEYLQTDAAINPGNSGGPLINLKGEIIGINAAIFSTQKSRTPGWQGVGFAIPSNFAKVTLETLLKKGRMPTGYLGVFVQDITPQLSAQLPVEEKGAVLVTDVAKNSPAEKAGLQRGDVLVGINAVPLSGPESLRRLIASLTVGEKATLEIYRNGERQQLTAKIAEQPKDFTGMITPQPTPEPSQAPAQTASTLFNGVSVVSIPEAHRAQLPPDISGVMVSDIASDSPAADVLQPGDIIEQVNRVPVQDLPHFSQVLAQFADAQKMLLLVCHDGHRTFVILSTE